MDATEELPTAVGGGLVLGRYRLGARLGSGGFGTVFAARDERLDRAVAVKAVPAAGPVPERAQREALAAARLDHPGIVAVFDAGVEGNERFLVSELVRGRTLAVLERDGELSDRDVLRIGLSLADALAHAHARGVIHRDVKPQNVIVPDEAAGAAAKLLDFGVAHLAGDEPLTRTGDVVGTLAYMAPEQAAGRRVDERADIYSLALVLYEALAGANPVRAGSPAETARRVGTRLPSLRRQRRDLPAELCLVIDTALEPDPEHRGTLADLAAGLADALPDVDDEGGTLAPLPAERRRIAVPARLAAGAAAGALAAAALIAAREAAEGGALDAARDGAGNGALDAARDGTAGALVAAGDVPVLAAALGVAVAVTLLPRLGWLLAAAGGVAIAGEPAMAAAMLAASPLLLPRDGLVWSVPAAAPLLGLAGLAGAYPALAGAARRAWTRAALGAAGLWWLLLAEPLLDRDLALGTRAGDLPDPVALTLAPLWALAALVLPWLVAGRAIALDVIGATVWAAALAAATATVADGAGLAEPRGLAAGAVLAGALAFLVARARNTVNAEDDRA
ncbi:MAG TPA: serine/threonine-protein kinase [Solirubrobacteraceae bacterium]|nr:serine/threonine-protein kinase [Solirubrobacteraceae bacterium]